MLESFLNQFWPATVDGLSLGAIYALVALGYTMVYGVLRLINFAHSEVFMVGTVAALFTLTTISVSGQLGGVALIGMLLLIAVVAIVASGLTAVGLEYIAYRPLRKRGGSRLAALISAIGASLFLQQLFALIVIPGLFQLPQEGGRLPVQAPAWVQRSDVITIGDFVVRNDKLLVVVGAVVMMVALDQVVEPYQTGSGHSSHGTVTGERRTHGSQHRSHRHCNIRHRRSDGRCGSGPLSLAI